MPAAFTRILLLLCLTSSVFAQDVSVFRKKIYQHAAISICVLDLKSSKTIVQFNAGQGVTPASVLKLLTTGAALELLGPDRRFETKLDYSGKIENGVLTGDVLIRGGGDPSLGSRQAGGKVDSFLAGWVGALQAAGVREIKGRILADARIFDDEPVSPFWLWEDMGNYYAPGIYGLAVFDNSFRLELKSGAAGTRPEMVSIQPEMPGMTIDNHLLAANNDQDSAYLYGAPYQQERRLFGTMPANRASFVIRGDMPDPPAYLAKRFFDELRAAGIKVSGTAGSLRQLTATEQAALNSGALLCSTKSIPLSQMVRIIHEKSDNFYTEYLLRQLALTVSGQPASAREGLKVVRDFWGKRGLDLTALALYDACGLSPNDRVSAAFLAQALRYMSVQSKQAAVFEASLPLAGVEGTVSGFLKGSPLEGKLRLKSGSNQVVNSYAGYLTQKGRSYAVVMMVNYADASRSQIRKDMETFLLSL
jgi:serine-type D-Ala-D-Ala carboxypeptidase/endopeptidase (penicillin-binding protein 4)